MGMVVGTNCGFVLVAPTADPVGAGGSSICDAKSSMSKFTTPAAGITVSEIGWWSANTSEESNFEVGIYTDNAGAPDALIAGSNLTNAKGTTSDWKKSTVSIALSASTNYWLAIQVDNTATATQVDRDTTIGAGSFQNSSASTTLADPAGGSSIGATWALAIYGLYTEIPPAGGGSNLGNELFVY